MIDFYFDIASPYTYLAATQIDDRAAEVDADVRWIPFLLGGVFKATGNDMPAKVPNKASFMLQDLNRWADIYGVEFNFPANFPLFTITTQRAMTALWLDERDAMKPVAMDLFRRYWVEGEDITEPERIVAAIDSAGADGEKLIARAGDDDVKAELRRLTDQAVDAGAFGAPTFIVEDALFFGNDRIDHVLRHIESTR